MASQYRQLVTNSPRYEGGHGVFDEHVDAYVNLVESVRSPHGITIRSSTNRSDETVVIDLSISEAVTLRAALTDRLRLGPDHGALDEVQPVSDRAVLEWASECDHMTGEPINDRGDDIAVVRSILNE